LFNREETSEQEEKTKMRANFYSLTLATLLATGLAVAAPQDQDHAAAPEAGQAAHRQPDPERQIKMLSKRLNLTTDQQQQIRPILTDRQQQFENIRNDNSLSPSDRRAKMKTVRDDSDAKIKAVLTDSQKQTYEQMQQQMRERMQQHRGEQQNGNSGPGAAN
jgi:protein CpxP